MYPWCSSLEISRRHPLVGLRGGWGAWLMKFKTVMMAAKRTRRSISDSSEDEMNEDFPLQNNFPSFIVIESEDESKPMSKVSPFIIEKQIQSILGTPKSVKKLKNGTLLVQCRTKKQVDNLLSNKLFFGIKVKVYPHPTLNSCKGIIRCPDLANCTGIDEIKKNLKPKGVKDVYRIKTKRNGQLKETHTYILTFDTPILPDHIVIDFQKFKIEPYIPNPLRCFQCQKFGHHIKNCRADAVCAKCSEKGHTVENCQNDAKCANCGDRHPSFSKQCSIWKKEKEIQRVKLLQNLSFQEARKQVESSFPSVDKPTYAQSVKGSSNDQCQTCTIIIEELSKHFPQVAESIFEKLNIQKSNSSKTQSSTTNKSGAQETSPSSAPSSAPATKTNASKTKPITTETKQTLNQDNQKPKHPPAEKPKDPSSDKPKQKPSQKTTSTEKKQKLHRYKVNENSDTVDVVLAPIPTDKNRFSHLEEMEAEDDEETRPTSGWGDHTDSWEDQKDSWEDSPPSFKSHTSS